ncbi:MAG: hypothetical protein A2V63_11290 [Candidatus Eisenbacteria bacterium RBG_19FT_COMBO_70_11]|nr:MAG: hypothetical protein A2V63_11290 [Candidatus Eisenbacteria bacterium RBG_19FT_COMBO_70_11]
MKLEQSTVRCAQGLAAALLLLASVRPAAATMPTPSGTIPEPVREAFRAGLLEPTPRPRGLGTSSVQLQWRVPVVLVSFSDDSLTFSAADFDRALFDTTGSTSTGSAFDYYRWVSGGRVRVEGKAVATVHLPHDRYYYNFGSWGLNTVATPNNIYGAIRDGLILCDAQVDWSPYDVDHDGFVDVLWFVHAGIGGENSPGDRNHMWSITSRLSGGWRYGAAFTTSTRVPGSTNQFIRIDRFSTLPEISGILPGRRAEIGVYCHEFGHALGLPDLYDTSQPGGGPNVGPGNWALMSTGATGTNGVSPEYPSHLGAWSMLFLGWATTVRPIQDSTLTLPPIEQGGPIVELWFQGEDNPEHFLIENRQRIGFDRFLPSPGLIVSHVDEATIGQRLGANGINSGLTPGLRVVEADGDTDLVLGRNRGDANDPFPGALGRTEIDDGTLPSLRTFLGTATDIAVRGITAVDQDVRFRVEVRSPGWLPAEDRTGAEPFEPTGGFGPAARARVDGDGTLYVVHTEMRSGRPQVVLRTREGNDWGSPLDVSHSPTAALDPTLALLPGGDLALVWSDTRSGSARLYYRARVRGTWTSERELVTLPGDARYAALGADPSGLLHLAWLQLSQGTSRVMFSHFAYSTPFAQPVAVSDSAELPGPPALAVAPGGGAYVLWPDQRGTSRIRFARYAPDSGISGSLPFTHDPLYPQSAVTAAVDPSGALQAVWLEVSGGESQLRYQRRAPGGPPSPPDSLVETRPETVQNPVLEVDPSGGLHLAFESAYSGVRQIRYKSMRPGRGWDYRSTEVSFAGDGDATRVSVLPTSPGNVTIVYAVILGGETHFTQRIRQLEPTATTAVPRPAAQPAFALAVGPNPLRAGVPVEIRWAGAAAESPPVVEFFDVAGRRVASVPLEGAEGVRRGRLDGARTARWSSGVYFARVRGGRAASLRLIVLR